MLGYRLAVVFLPRGWIVLGVDFLLFRLFDILKLPPMGWLDRHVRGGWGGALSALSPRDRSVVLMREMQGMSYEEMTRALDIPLGTLKAMLHRARERLRRALVGSGVTP